MADFQVSLQYKINWGKPNNDGVILPLDSKLDDVARGLAEKHGSLGGGAGSGMGFRDMEFEFATIAPAEEFKAALASYPLFLDVTVAETTSVEDMLREIETLLPKVSREAQEELLSPYMNLWTHGPWDAVVGGLIDRYIETTDETIKNGDQCRDELLDSLDHLRSDDVKNNQN